MRKSIKIEGKEIKLSSEQLSQRLLAFWLQLLETVAPWKMCSLSKQTETN